MKDRVIDILNDVCACFEVSKEALLSRDRRQEIADVRHFAVYEIMKTDDLKLKALATIMRRDRTTLMYSSKLVENLLSIKDRKFVTMERKFFAYQHLKKEQEQDIVIMKIKLNRAQLEGVELLMRVLLNENKPKDIAELLVRDIVYKLYQKIRAKTEVIGCPRSGYGVSLTNQEAMAFYIYYQNVEVDAEGYKYEAFQLQRIFAEIDRIY
ncbi:MAG: hypothetical protein K2Q03_05975 [Sphingobacteriaceae bacterium]|nr:hypothetical protein [Sphingobacteriaceae bacterium]